MANFTPMMEQYFEVKKQYPNTILFFRIGDFYEMFYEDAKTASKVLDLVLTGKDCGQEERAPMCGIPFHSADPYVAKLVAKGYKVAICEQTEDPALAKGLVKRDVIRVITPGTVTDGSMLDESRNNYLACICKDTEQAGVCFADVSTGDVHLTLVSGEQLDSKITNELARFFPKEVILNGKAAISDELKYFLCKRLDCTGELFDDEYFDFKACESTVLKHFSKNNLTELSIDNKTEAVCALGAALRYLYETQKSDLDNIREFDFYSETEYMKLDISARRNLELTETLRSKEKRGTLLWVLDKTKTAMGKRLIRSWIEQPLVSCTQIIKRQNAVEELYSDSILRQDEISLLSEIYDIERLMTRIVYGTANARELKSLSFTAQRLKPIKERISGCKGRMMKEIYEDIDLLEDVYSLIESSIVEDPPFSLREGGLIKEGYNGEIDELHSLMGDNIGILTSIEEREQEKTGIKKLKIGYNRVFGYYLEVPNASKDMVPDDYIRKQTLSNCERYITQELKDLESRVLGAKERDVQLEYELFTEIRSKVAEQLSRIQRTAHAVAKLDVLCSLAQAAAENNYSRPDVTPDTVLDIKEGRHPVVELMLDGAPFVPNDTLLDCGENRVAIITGPNMAGKSTYMRQVALIVLMAQIGSFVPAKSARVGIVDSIFTRVGASDDLASGQSTFMVEMSEVADILENATSKSLIVFDEIGRGTSTFDGMSIARAVLEYTADKKKLGAKTLFATHYHELTALEGEIDGVKNYNIAVKKRGDDITFLRRIIRGGADDSYGIEVAKLAGIPEPVVRRAKIILKSLSLNKDNIIFRKNENADDEEAEDMQISMTDGTKDEIIEKLKNMDVNTLTPIEALTTLFELQKEANA